jgi:hypothetical protein
VLQREPYPNIDEALVGASYEFDIAEVRWTPAFAHPRDEVLALVETLPEGPDLSDVVPVVERVLGEVSLSPREVADALADCADKLWRAYEEPIPPEALRPRLIQRCRELLSLPNERVIDSTISTIVMLGLVELIPDLERVAADAQRTAGLRKGLAEAVLTLMTDPDPYSSLRRFGRKE